MKIKFDRQSIEKNEDVPIIRMLSEEKVVRIHDAAIEVLEKTGINIATESARKLLADAGCTVSRGSDIVKVPRRIVEDAIASCVKEITIYDREGVECMRLGGRRSYFGIGTTCIYFRDLVSGERRDAYVEDIALVCRVFDALPNLDFSATPLIARPTENIPQKIVNEVGFN